MERKLGIGTLNINKHFKTRDEAFKYAKRLREFIRYNCIKKKCLGQAIIVVSNTRKNVSKLKYIHNGQVGRPKKELIIDEYMANNYYKGNYKTDWHIHILIVSSPSYQFRMDIKDYISKNWRVDIKEVHKHKSNINITDYFINQSEDILFCNYNYSNEEDLKYTLKEYYYEYLKKQSNISRLYVKRRIKNMTDEKFEKMYFKIESRFNEIRNYYFEITKADDDNINDFKNK